MIKKIFLGTALFSTLFLFTTPTYADTEAEIREEIASIRNRLSALLTEVEEMFQTDMVIATFRGVPKDFRFTRHLRFRDQGVDVKYLQIILNADPATRLANSGIGSPGNEVDTFENITLNAVRRFQQKYASEILHPWGIKAPTGVVEIQTVTKLNKMLEGESVIKIIDPTKKREIQIKLLAILKDIQDLRRKVSGLEGLGEGAADAPTNLRAAIIGYGEVRLTWTGNRNAEYFVGYKATRSGGPYTEVGVTEKTSGIVTGLGRGRSYFLVVTQVVNGRESGYSREVKVTMDLEPTPFNVRTKATDVGELTLTWETDQQNITKYRIYRGDKTGGPYTLLGESRTRDFVDTTAGLHTMRYYVVTQVIGGRESGYSVEHIDSWFYNFQGGTYPHPEKDAILANLTHR